MKRTECRVIVIDPKKRTVEEAIGNELSQLQGYVGGYIEVAMRLKKSDVLLVDEEGLMKEHRHGFFFQNKHYVGNGVVCRLGETNVNATVDEIRRAVKWTERIGQ